MHMKWSEVKVAQSCPTLCNPMDYTVHGILQARILEWVTFPSPEHLPNPGIEPRSPALQADSLPAEPQGKPKKTGVGSLSLLQGIFPTQESNWVVSCIAGGFLTNWSIREAVENRGSTHIFLSANALHRVGILYVYLELNITQGLKNPITAITLPPTWLDHPCTQHKYGMNTNYKREHFKVIQLGKN